MKKSVLSVSLLAGVLAICLPVLAHHGSSAYDMKEVPLKAATVSEFVWANPHTIITFDAKDASGKVQHWAGELGSPSALTNLGWTKASVKQGDVIDVFIHQSKTGNPVGRITRIVLADGSSLKDSSGTGGGDDNTGGGRGGRGGRGGGSTY